MRAKWLTIALTLAMFVASLFALPLIPAQFFPSSDRPELLVDLRLPQNASIFASETVARRIRRLSLRTIRMSRAGAPTSAAARSASICRSTCNCRTTSSARPSSSPRMCPPATACRRSWKMCWPMSSPASRAASHPLELGPPVGWPVQYRISGPEIAKVRDIALKARAGHCGKPERRAHQFRLVRAGPAGSHPDRPERGPPARAKLAGARRRAQHGHLGQRDYASSR